MRLDADTAPPAHTALKETIARTAAVTYFSGAFVFDGELALFFAVADVAQLVVENIRGRRRQRRKTGQEHGE